VRNKRVIDEARDIATAAELIRLGARLQLLESETRLSREKLLRLYKEILGKSPPKGMLPFSTDWFMTWQPNIHASLFAAMHRHLLTVGEISGMEALAKAYRLYMEHCTAHGLPQVLSLTRAWRLVKFIDAGMLTTTPCTLCKGRFVVHAYDLTHDYVCGLCHVPSRAGKTRARSEAEARAAELATASARSSSPSVLPV
jgi:flagellar transcriptional activator FlhC